MGAWSTRRADRPRLTPKGERIRARIVEEAAALIHERGVAGDHLGRRQGGSGSQRLAAVPLLPRQERTRAGGHRLPSRHHRQSPAARARQRERSRSLAEHGDHRGEAHQSKGGLPTWFARWSTRRERPRGPSAHRGRVRSVGSRHQRWTADPSMPTGSSRPDIDPDDLATTLLATLQGGLLLAQVQRSTRPFETAVDTLLALAIGR